jgi:transcriptional regulator with XRE-family HTH domain
VAGLIRDDKQQRGKPRDFYVMDWRITVAEAASKLTGGNKSKLAAKLGVDRSTVAGWENPQRRKKGLCGVIPEKYLMQVSELLADASPENVNAPRHED